MVNLKVKRTLRNNISVCFKTCYFFKNLNQLHLRLLKAYCLEVCAINYFPHVWPENDCNRCRLEYMWTHTLMPALRCGAEPVGSSILLLLKSASLGRTVIQAPRGTKFRRWFALFADMRRPRANGDVPTLCIVRKMAAITVSSNRIYFIHTIHGTFNSKLQCV